MRRRFTHLLLAAAFLSWANPLAYAQGTTTSSVSGVVLDEAGGVIPGATVVVKNNATSTTNEVVTNERGAFSVPALDVGVYTVTVTLVGFKTAIVNNLRLEAAVPADLKIMLEIGALEESITVTGGSELVQTRTTTVSSTMTVDQIQNLPLPTRNAVNFATFLPGVNTTGRNRDSNFNGLPDSAVAITLDGINNNENYNKSTEGLFAMVTPRQDAVEAVTVTSAVQGSDTGGHGAVTLRFVTRSGTDRFAGSLYEYYRSPKLNTNYYFNAINDLPKNDITLNQYGGRVGGPIVIPGLYDGRGKAFFFFNYEELRLPNEFTRTRTILDPDSQNGLFQYSTSSGVRSVDLYALAAANGQLATPDPTVASVLTKIRSLTQGTGTINPTSDPNTLQYAYLSPGDQMERQPVTRLDYNLSAKHRVSGSYYWQQVSRDPDMLNGTDPNFPGALNFRRYLSYRKLGSWALRSAFSSNLVNEVRGGIKYGPSMFGRAEWNGPESFSDQGGRALVLGNVGQSLTNLYRTFSVSQRSAWSWNLDDTVNWQWGDHAFSFGGSYYDGHTWVLNQSMVPQIQFGVESSDPANAMFTTANFPGASSTQLNRARSLYALLTGRVNRIDGDARLDEDTNQYVLQGPRTQRLRQQEWGFFWHDTWRMNSSFTLNAGLRWDLVLPVTPTNDIMSVSTLADLCGISGIGPDGSCNLFQPGVLTGVRPSYVQYNAGSPGYDTDWNNFAPNVGIAWRPQVQDGWLRSLLGDPEQATIRAGYSLAFEREGMARYTGQFGANPGSTIQADRTVALGNLVYPGESWPLLLRDESRLGLPAIPTSPEYPIYATVNDDINIFDPNIRTASAHSIIASLQRALTHDMAVEVRYVGTWGRGRWDEVDLNGGANRNIVENGFLDEFKLAQANLQANIAAGRGNTFRYYGPGTGTSPLPTYLAYFSGVPASRAGDASLYTSSLFRSSNFVNPLAQNNPQPYTPASDSSSAGLFGSSSRRANALRAGLAENFFIVNPNVDNDNVYQSKGFTNYNALQVDLRRRLSRGLQLTFNYQYARGYEEDYLGERWGYLPQLRVEVPRHAFKTTWNWNVPVGQGRRFGSGMSGVLNAVLGGWEFHGSGRVQNRLIDFGNVRLVGMTADDLQEAYRIREGVDVDGVRRVWILPDDIILNTRRAHNVSATSSTGYSALGVPEGRYIAPANSGGCIQVKNGDCAPRHLYIFTPWFTRFDISVAKRFQLPGRMNFEVRLDVMNVFDNVNFNPVAAATTNVPFSSEAYGQVTSAYTDPSNTFDPGGRLGQFVLRFNW